MAKAPVPGLVKTRLCPPATPDQAAALAQACLADTLAMVAMTPARWRAVALDGDPGPWLGTGIDVIVQRGRGLAERLAAAFTDAEARYGTGPAMAIGADTPQLTPAALQKASVALSAPGTDAVIGPATDGGYWVIGLQRPDPRVFEGVPMSHRNTLAVQLHRLVDLGLRTTELATYRDVDTIEDAWAVAAEAPTSLFAACLTTMKFPPDQSTYQKLDGGQPFEMNSR